MSYHLRRGDKWVKVTAEEYAAHRAASVSSSSRSSAPSVPSVAKKGLGDLVERAVKPIAKAFKHPCLQPDDTLRPGSPCAKIKAALNKLTQ